MKLRLGLYLMFLCVIGVVLAVKQPVGSLRLFSQGDAICGDLVWTNGNADGARLRLSWAQLEPSEGVYAWTGDTGSCVSNCTSPSNDFDCALQRAAATKKWIGVSISAGVNVPHWVYDNYNVYKFQLDIADQTAEGGDQFMPLIWDTRFQTKWQAFINALASHVNSLPTAQKTALRYMVITGHCKSVDTRTWCQNFDASYTTTATTTIENVSCPGVAGGVCVKITSPDAHFTTRSNPECVDGSGLNCTVGKLVSDPDPSNPIQLRPNSAIINTAQGAPANPTDSVVYLSRDTAAGTCSTPCTNKVVNVEQWLINRGEFYRMDQAAISPPGGFPGLVGTANPNGMDGNGVTAPMGNYVPAAKTIGDYWLTAFPNTVVILTQSPPYATTQGEDDADVIDDYLTATYGDRYGPMVVNRQATCYPHQPPVGWTTFAKGAQAMLPSGSQTYYAGGTCLFRNIYPQRDWMDAAFGKSDKYWEHYQGDIESMDPVTGTPGLALVAAYERSRLRFSNPQVEDRAAITLR